MPATKKLIQTITVTSATVGNIEFTSIPQNFTDLQIVASARTSNASTTAGMYVIINNDFTTGNYVRRILQGNGSSVGSYTFANVLALGSIPGANATANTFGSSTMYIPNYSGTAAKTSSAEGVSENNATNANAEITASRWSGTAPITSIYIYADSALVQNSTFSLYGVLKGSGGSNTDIIRYDFNSGVEGWTANNANLSASGGILTQSVINNDPHMMSPSVSFAGSAGRYLKVIIKKVNTGQSTGWDGSVFYSTIGHGYSESYKHMMPEPTWDGTYKTITMDMWNLFAGGSDWQNNTITSIRLDFGNTLADGNFLIDSIAISPNP